jgi:hypothetical protein
LPDAYEGERPYGSALYFPVAPDDQIVMHRIRSDQLYHHYVGDPLEVLMLYYQTGSMRPVPEIGRLPFPCRERLPVRLGESPRTGRLHGPGEERGRDDLLRSRPRLRGCARQQGNQVVV